eukprot:365279-Chlamydomonas_euryale.AAC.3
MVSTLQVGKALALAVEALTAKALAGKALAVEALTALALAAKAPAAKTLAAEALAVKALETEAMATDASAEHKRALAELLLPCLIADCVWQAHLLRPWPDCPRLRVSACMRGRGYMHVRPPPLLLPISSELQRLRGDLPCLIAAGTLQAPCRGYWLLDGGLDGATAAGG